MIRFFQGLTFSHWSFLVAAIATLATLIGGFVQLRKDLDEAKEERDTEIRRRTEYDSLLTKSIAIQNASNKLIIESDTNLGRQLILQ